MTNEEYLGSKFSTFMCLLEVAKFLCDEFNEIWMWYVYVL